MSHSNGFHHWLMQRATALYMLFFCIGLLLFFATSQSLTYQSWLNSFASPWVLMVFGLFFLSLLYHAWIGLKDIVIDYIHPQFWRLTVLGFIAFSLLGCGIWLFTLLIQAYGK